MALLNTHGGARRPRPPRSRRLSRSGERLVRVRGVAALWLIVVACGVPAARATDSRWIEDSFEDFSDGRLDASGVNIYVSRDGRVRTIHRFDLDQDGFVDLLFNSTHDTRQFVPATEGRVLPGGQVVSSPLAVEGSRRIALADLDRDGWRDVVFCPNQSGLQSPRRYLTILWGGEDGWPRRRSNGMLPVRDAEDVAIADLDADGWPDIACLNASAWRREQPEGRIVRVYFGGEAGFLLSRRLDLGVPGALALASGDLDGDGGGDLAVLRAGGEVRVYWASRGAREIDAVATTDLAIATCPRARAVAVTDADGDGRLDIVVGSGPGDGVVVILSTTSRPGADDRGLDASRSFGGFPASHVSAGDLDGDGQVDLVLTEFEIARAAGGEEAGAAREASDSVRVLWGDLAGHARERATTLAVAAAAATAVGDVDGDGREDLVVAVHQSESTYAAVSPVFAVGSDRVFTRLVGGIAGQGARDVAIAPAEGDLPARVVLANSVGGATEERVPLQLYRGGPDGFRPERRIDIPFRSGYEATAADLDADGWVDLVAIDSQHAGPRSREDDSGGAVIFRGGAAGFDPSGTPTVLRESLLGTSNVADLDRDGWLDLVLGVFDAVSAEESTPLIIRYGSSSGFTRRVALPSPGRSIGSVIADFDRDDWLDIAVTSYYVDRVRIFRGGADGFAAERQSTLEVPGPIGIETADIDRDGWLDLVVGSYMDPETHDHDTGTLVFWGGAAGFQPSNAQRLPGWAPVGHAIADLDGDGWLDLFTPHYLGERMRESLPSYIFWGGDGGFASHRRTTLVCDSAHDAVAADFDHDGRLDLAVSCHSRDGDHHTDSLVFHNDGRRFQEPRIVRLPTHGPHWIWREDMGHIYHRRWEETYESSVRELDGGHTGGTLKVRAEVPGGAGLEMHVRSAPSRRGLERRSWRPLHGERFALDRADRHLQYRATLRSRNGDRYPVLDRVEVEVFPLLP